MEYRPFTITNYAICIAVLLVLPKNEYFRRLEAPLKFTRSYQKVSRDFFDVSAINLRILKICPSTPSAVFAENPALRLMIIHIYQRSNRGKSFSSSKKIFRANIYELSEFRLEDVCACALVGGGGLLGGI